MSCICPSITPTSVKEYKEQIDRVVGFSERIHLDLMDGEFVETRSPELINYWWPDGLTADIHLMYQHPERHIETIISLKPSLIIVHAEADGFKEFVDRSSEFEKLGIKRGVAILADTPISSIEELMDKFDHVLIFSGHLGHYGGTADLGLLSKVSQIRSTSHELPKEIGWDGGVNLENVKQLVNGGIEVLNVGGAIQRADDPGDMYLKLVRSLE